jgi:hypothetical protein
VMLRQLAAGGLPLNGDSHDCDPRTRGQSQSPS